MTFTRDFFAFLTCTAMVMVYDCNADWPNPPTGLSYRWLDPFTVAVSWQKPSGPPDGEVLYKYRLSNAPAKSAVCTRWRNFTETHLTEETGSDHWTYIVWTVGGQSCNSEVNSTPVDIKIHTPRPRAEVKDMKCFISPKEINCSWIPGSQTFNLSYRICKPPEQRIKGLKACHQPYRSAIRNGCHLKADAINNEICVVVDTGAGLSTFKVTLVSSEIYPPKLSIREEGDNLILSWTPPEIGRSCGLLYEVCYKQCNEPEKCLNFTKREMPYDRRCRYEFRSRVMKNDYCKIFSDYGDVVHYGTNKPPDGMPLVVAIVIPIILSVCIILSCYCLRRHSSIICPIIPDPSAIFKEMMMNGNKELKTTSGSLYTPVPEPIDPCKITLVTENSVLQQNS